MSDAFICHIALGTEDTPEIFNSRFIEKLGDTRLHFREYNKLLEDVLCKIDHLENAVAAIDTRGQTVSLVSFWKLQCNQERLQFQFDPN